MNSVFFVFIAISIETEIYDLPWDCVSYLLRGVILYCKTWGMMDRVIINLYETKSFAANENRITNNNKLGPRLRLFRNVGVGKRSLSNHTVAGQGKTTT